MGNSGKILSNDFNCDVTDTVTSLKPRKYHNKNGEFFLTGLLFIILSPCRIVCINSLIR